VGRGSPICADGSMRMRSGREVALGAAVQGREKIETLRPVGSGRATAAPTGGLGDSNEGGGGGGKKRGG